MFPIKGGHLSFRGHHGVATEALNLGDPQLGNDVIAVLIDTMRLHLPAMLARGGSHRGTIDPELRADLERLKKID